MGTQRTSTARGACPLCLSFPNSARLCLSFEDLLLKISQAMQKFLVSKILTLTGVICFLCLAFTVTPSNTSGDAGADVIKESEPYCIKGPDPICYFPPSGDRTLSGRKLMFPQPEQYYLNIKSRISDGSQREIGAEYDDEEYDDLYPFSDDISSDFKPLEGTQIDQPVQLQYEKDWTEVDNTYPPWTYRGFYPPAEWHLIPWHYFNPKSNGTGEGVYTGTMIKKMTPGISFMEFPQLRVKYIKLHLENCSNSAYPAPLDIIRENAVENHAFGRFNFINFDVEYAFIMFLPEDGTDLLFVKVQTPFNDTSKKPQIEAGATTGPTLFLDRLLIHMGENATNGSEHKIDGESFGMELQFFFNKQTSYEPNKPYYSTLEDYMVKKKPELYGKDLLVLCLLVVVVPENEKPPPGKKFNKGMDYLSQAAEQFARTKNHRKYRSFANTQKCLRMDDFFNEVRGEYYTYYGTLTHPPCLNNTRYAIFETPIYISTLVWRRFLYIPSQFSDSGFVAPNFRPMDSLMLMDTRTNKTVSYEGLHLPYKHRLSFTISKSGRKQRKDDDEYDYYETSASTVRVLTLGWYFFIIVAVY